MSISLARHLRLPHTLLGGYVAERSHNNSERVDS